MTNSNSECWQSIIAKFEFKKVLVNNLQSIISHYEYRVSLNSVLRNSEQENILREDTIFKEIQYDEIIIMVKLRNENG